jgi:hypothetical protein
MIEEYGEKDANEIIEYSYEHSVDPSKEVVPNNLRAEYNLHSNNALAKIQQYNEAMRQMNSNNRIIPPGINRYSPVYGQVIAAKPRASASANIRMGGIY